MIAYANKHFVGIKIDAEKGEGPELKKQFRIPGYPSMIFLNSKGEEIDRMIGYLPPDRFLEELKRIKAGTNTYASAKEAVDKDPANAEALSVLAEKYTDMNQSELALTMWYKLKDLNDPDFNALAEFKIISMESSKNKSAAKLIDFMDSNKNSPYYLDAVLSSMTIFRSLGADAQEAKMYKEYVVIQEKAGELTYSILNGYAWRMTELGLNLEDALTRAKTAVDLAGTEDSESRAQVLDTLAEVYWKLGNNEKAIETIKLAIGLQPEDSYYKEQLEKYSA